MTIKLFIAGLVIAAAPFAGAYGVSSAVGTAMGNHTLSAVTGR